MNSFEVLKKKKKHSCQPRLIYLAKLSSLKKKEKLTTIKKKKKKKKKPQKLALEKFLESEHPRDSREKEKT
jgi:hypothetical protein